jgi:hypothetical protein
MVELQKSEVRSQIAEVKSAKCTAKLILDGIHFRNLPSDFCNRFSLLHSDF